MSKLAKIMVCSLRYEPADRPLLEEWAARVLGGESARRGKNEERLDAHLAGRAAVAWLLEQRGCHYTVRPDPHFGYLQVVDGAGREQPRLHVNISHTADRAVAVVAMHSVGIDIESSMRDGNRVYRRVPTAAELARLPRLPTELGLPEISLWSAKEAFSKAVGLGMNFGLQEFQIILEGSPPFSAQTALRGPLPLVDPALVFEVRDGFVIAVCGERTELELGLRWHYLQAAQLRNS